MSSAIEKKRRADLSSKNLHNPKGKGALMLVIGTFRFWNYIQTVCFWNKKTKKEEVRQIEHTLPILTRPKQKKKL